MLGLVSLEQIKRESRLSGIAACQMLTANLPPGLAAIGETGAAPVGADPLDSGDSFVL